MATPDKRGMADRSSDAELDGCAYPHIVRSICTRYAIEIHKWRTNMSGCAWRTWYADGRAVNWIEAPLPKTPISLALFLHEVGHHVIGFDRYRRRCEEEFHVWMWALSKMRELGIEPDGRVMNRVERSMRYAVSKAVKRGLKALPQALDQYLPKAA